MNSRSTPVRVLIVDNSALMRQLLATLLEADPEIEVVGTAADPHIARERIKALNPDVITLDIEMPHMDGLTFLRKIMTLRPTPVVMISTLTQRGAEITLEALEIGAVDFIAKPTEGIAEAMADLGAEIQAKVKVAASSRVGVRRAAPVASVPRPQRVRRLAPDKIVFVGASTGGVEALKMLLLGLPADCPPVLITQHMPPRFTTGFAQRLDRECPMKVSEATDDEPIEPGHVYIAPGSHHLEIARHGSRNVCRLFEGATVSGHRPSVDVLFRSAARTTGKNAVGAILTGMGKDGAEGLLELRRAGAITLGQDEGSSLIYGMPRVAFERGAVMRQYPLEHMAEAISTLAGSMRVTRAAAPTAKLTLRDESRMGKRGKPAMMHNGVTKSQLKLPAVLDLAAAENFIETMRERLQLGLQSVARRFGRRNPDAAVHPNHSGGAEKLRSDVRRPAVERVYRRVRGSWSRLDRTVRNDANRCRCANRDVRTQPAKLFTLLCRRRTSPWPSVF